MLSARDTQGHAHHRHGVLAQLAAPHVDLLGQLLAEDHGELHTPLRVLQAAQLAQGLGQLKQQLEARHTPGLATGLTETHPCLHRPSPMSRYACLTDLRS